MINLAKKYIWICITVFQKWGHAGLPVKKKEQIKKELENGTLGS